MVYSVICLLSPVQGVCMWWCIVLRLCAESGARCVCDGVEGWKQRWSCESNNCGWISASSSVRPALLLTVWCTPVTAHCPPWVYVDITTLVCTSVAAVAGMSSKEDWSQWLVDYSSWLATNQTMPRLGWTVPCLWREPIKMLDAEVVVDWCGLDWPELKYLIDTQLMCMHACAHMHVILLCTMSMFISGDVLYSWYYDLFDNQYSCCYGA